MKPLLSRLSLIAFFLLAACAAPDSRQADWYATGSPAESHGHAIYRSPADDREYRHLTLDNGLQVLLVSDAEAEKAAASMSVRIGSFDNPEGREGLAHFLEHMLFLGTDRYPEPGEYQTFISEQGGSHNAYTSLEETNYFFDINAPHLMPALDRFSRFFVAPLFNPDYVQRERSAVQSEYQLRLKDDGRREWDVVREVVNPEHPLSMFSVGSVETLADREGSPVREDLLAFYRDHYSAEHMNLVVLGRESLDELEQAVTARFAEVPGRDLELPERDIPLFDRELPFRVHIQPEKEVRKLAFSFPVPSVKHEWRVKPLTFLGHLIGHEGEGSLLAKLKAEGLAEGLAAGLAFDSRAGAMFTVSIQLTPEGVGRHEDISRDFFAWLDLIRSRGIEQWRYREVADISRLHFRFAEKQQPSGYVRTLSNRLHTYPPAEVLRGPFHYADFDAATIAELAGYLSPDNTLVALTAPDVETDTLSRYYNAPYRVEPLARDALDGTPQVAELSLPPPNHYIPEALAIYRPDEKRESPSPVDLSGAGTLWHYPDSRFDSPRARFDARLTLPELTLEQEVLLDLYIAMVADQLSAEAYPAVLAGLGFDLSRWDSGIRVRVQGYSDKQPLLLATVLDAMAAPDLDAGRFDRIKDSLQRSWRNSARDWPVQRAFAHLPALIRDGWLATEKAEVLRNIELSQLNRFADGLFRRGHGVFYAGGNIDGDTARAMADNTLATLALGEEGPAQAAYRVKKLRAAEDLPDYQVATVREDTAALLYLQGRNDGLQERALFSLLQLVADAPFFNSLRTEQQLGYVVGSSTAAMHRVPGLVFYVQSPVAGRDRLEQAMNDFFRQLREQVRAMSEADLERYRAAVLARIEETPRNLGELLDRHSEALELDYLDFDYRQRLAAAVRSVTLVDLEEAYDRVFLAPRRGLWLMSHGEALAGPPARDRLLQDTEGAFVYPR